ncbi:MAG TPA: SGNH/GDSL hydrolase family protein [Solirubrobacteraceae bacterium]|nr:SGNH/GDSL hydrolase family protein [Solirubrobacteraceae bacterium]
MISLARAVAALVLAAAVAAGCGHARRTASSLRPPPAAASKGARHPVVIAALGDSITAGSPLWDPDSAVRNRLGDRLNQQSQYEFWAQRRLGPRVSFRNCGVYGERTDQIARRLPGCARSAQALIIQGGINDIVQGRPVALAARDLRAMVRAGKRLGLRVELVDVLPWNNGYPRADRPIRRLNRRIAAIGRREHVRVLPFYRTLDDPARPGRMPERLTIDGDHPSPPGYRMLGDLIRLP